MEQLTTLLVPEILEWVYDTQCLNEYATWKTSINNHNYTIVKHIDETIEKHPILEGVDRIVSATQYILYESVMGNLIKICAKNDLEEAKKIAREHYLITYNEAKGNA
jgi:hypothetical protein